VKAYWGSGGIAPHILDLGTRWRWVFSFTARPLYLQGKSPWYPWDRRLGGPQRRSGRGGEEKNSQPPPGIEAKRTFVDCSANIVTKLWARWPGFNSRQGAGFLFFVTASRPALRSTKRPIRWVFGAVSPGVKWSGREYDHLPLSSADVKSAWSYTSTPPYVFTAWSLVKHRDTLTLSIIGT
jgi:hypothetical protein